MTKVIKVKGITNFKKGMCLKSTYSWKGEPSRTYYYKITKPLYKGKGAYSKITKVLEDGKNKLQDGSIGQESFIWDYNTQIGKIKNTNGTGRYVKC